MDVKKNTDNIDDLYRANEDLDPYDEEKYKNFVALTGIVRTHMGYKVKETNKKTWEDQKPEHQKKMPRTERSDVRGSD